MSNGKYTDIFQSTNQEKSKKVESESSRAVKEEKSKAVKKEKSKVVKEEREIVNMCIKVDKRLRRHWQSEVKKRDTTITAIIVEHLKEKLGEPD